MAAFDHFRNMYDDALKPRLLETLIRDHLPDEKHPFSKPSEISRVISLVKTHRLLSESAAESSGSKLIEAWKSAVNSWVNRILTLVSCGTADKCWLGVSLLGVTCKECSSDRFLEAYSVWLQKLLPFLQSPPDSQAVRVATCASISDLFARLSGYPNLKKEGSSWALKVIQPVLKLLNDDSLEAVLEGAIHLLCTIITSFPFSINRHYDSVESAIALKLFSGGCSLDMMKRLAYCLTLLPKSRGDEESWSVMMQKFLIVINDQLSFAFQGLEEETMRHVVIRLLVPPGKQPPPPLGNYILAEVSTKGTMRSENYRISTVSTLMFGCCTMLSNPYPVKINVPICLLLALVERILMVNGSLPQMSLPFMTSKQQEDICSELPVLHFCSLELLSAIIKALGSKLLLHAASITRIIKNYFKACALPELRIKVYSVIKTLLISQGIGMALSLAEEVVNNAVADLSTIENKSGALLNGSNSNASTGALLPPRHKKRKHSNTTNPLEEHDAGGGLGMEVTKNHPLTPIGLRIAALETLEALLTVGGGLKSEVWRSKVDNLLIVIATDSFKEGPTSEPPSFFQQKEPAATIAELQLAALRALLASFLSFARGRPPYLSQGLELFHRGKQETGTKVAEFSAHALLTLEVLIHPRELPIANYSSFVEAQSSFKDELFGRSKSSSFGLQVGHDTVDTDDYFLAKGPETCNEADDESLAKNTKHMEEPSEACRDNNYPKIQKSSEFVSEATTCADVEMRVVEDETILKSDQPRKSQAQFQEPVSCTTSNVPVVQDEGFESASQSNTILQRTSESSVIQEVGLKLERDNPLADEDIFPDIVDADPDSDSE